MEYGLNTVNVYALTYSADLGNLISGSFILSYSETNCFCLIFLTKWYIFAKETLPLALDPTNPSKLAVRGFCNSLHY